VSRKKARRARKSRPASDDDPVKQPAAAADIPAPRCWSGWLWGFLIVAATLGAYWPALRGHFVFDDPNWTTDVENLLRDSSGLWEIWTRLTALQQYYPVTGTSFWLDYQLWHWWTLPYHVENVLLHAASALLLWRLLQQLEAPGAWLAGALFALHPVMVESVAWITERKNVLSMFFFLAALLAYGRFTSFWKEETSASRGRFHALALVLFVGALLSKITAFALPAVLLLLCGWKRGRIRWKEDVLPIMPFFALSIGLGLTVAWLEKHHVGAQGADWDLSWTERILVAGRVPWFYAGKLLWPFHQCLIYPKWRLEAGSVLPWLFPVGTVAVLLTTWLLRARIGRGPVVALLCFVGTLLPVLGLMNFYWMRFSFVGDHLAYLSSPSALALGAALVVRGAERLRRPLLLRVFVVLVLPLLAVLTRREAGQYRDEETLWSTTVLRNPACWLAHNNLGNALFLNGKLDEAINHCQKALELKTDYAEAHINLGNAIFQKGQVDEAMVHYRSALEIKPDLASPHYNLGTAFLQMGQVDEAVGHFQKALEIKPDFAEAHYNLGSAFLQKGQVDEAVGHFQKALEIKPDFAGPHNNLGTAFLKRGQVEEAMVHYEAAIKINPMEQGALTNLAWILATSPEASLRNGARAVELAQRASQIAAGDYPNLLKTLAAAYAETGRFAEADETAERALSLALAQGNSALVEVIRIGRTHYQTGKPMRDIPPASEGPPPTTP
jgi:protein O-mannosyl-transferase